MALIGSIEAIEILDSRGNPTIKVMMHSSDGLVGAASVPSGASTGEHEAVELRDGDPKRYFGKGTLKAVSNVKKILCPLLKGKKIADQEEIDQLIINCDGSSNKSHLGANALLGVSLAFADLLAKTRKLPLYRSILANDPSLLPCPMMNIINGGAHADNLLDFQEFMVRPIGAPSFKEAVRYGVEVYHTLKKLLKEKGLSTSVGDEGGFAPLLKTNEETLDIILAAITKAGFTPGKDISIALDCAASEFYDKDQQHYVEKKGSKTKRTSAEQIAYLEKLISSYPIDSIEDGLSENDWDGWEKLTKKIGSSCQIVGDDIFVTNPSFLKRGIEKGVANSILIKVNQIGTLTETLEAIAIAKKAGYKTIISHRSGETEDTIIADIAVATESGQIKTGSLSRSDRTAKYNRLLEIENELNNRAQFAKI